MPPTLRATRFLTPSLLALALAIGTVSGAVGRDAATPSNTAQTGAVVTAAAGRSLAPVPTGEVLGVESGVVGASHLVAATRPDPTLPAPRPAVSSGSDTSVPVKYHGRNHIWMPSLRIDRSVAAYSCSNKSYPGNRVYRWGCAGRNNIYLFGHAHSVFKTLHDAYVSGRLKKGSMLYYADSVGSVRAYEVTWWKVTTPTKGTWAYAEQSKPSLTLQTCVGSRSQYRLIVRLTQVD
jgi:Sortase domain